MNHHHKTYGNSALAIFPSSSGFGWILFDGPLRPLEWGTSTVPGKGKGADWRNEHCLALIGALIARLRPETVVLEAFDGKASRRYPRTRRLSRSIIALAAMSETVVRIISRKEIAASFKSQKVKTRYEVATLVASWLREIRRLLPDKRKSYETDNANMALFNAAALLIVHYANPAEPF